MTGHLPGLVTWYDRPAPTDQAREDDVSPAKVREGWVAPGLTRVQSPTLFWARPKPAERKG